MQDEYVKAIDKLKMDDERKSEMRRSESWPQSQLPYFL